MQRLGILLLPFVLAACAGLPPQLALVTQAADGVSYVFTGKSGTDRIISAAIKKDCVLFRAVEGDAVCKPKQGSSGSAQALGQVEGGHPGAALDRPLEHEEIVALEPVLRPQGMADTASAPGGAAPTPPTPPRRVTGRAVVALDPMVLPKEMADIAPALGGVAQAPPTPVMGAAAFADRRRLYSPVGQPKPASARDAEKSHSARGSGREKIASVSPAKAKEAPSKAPRPKAISAPRLDPSYYVVVGTYRNWVTAVKNAGRQSQGVASVVTATRNGAKTHRVLIGPLDRVGASDARRLVRGAGYQSASLVRSCAAGTATGGPGLVPGQDCMDLRKTWR